MLPLSRLAFAIVLTVLAVPPLAGSTQAPARAQTQTDEQVYEKFLSWLDKQPQGGTDLDAQYRKVLAAEGVTAAEIDRQLRVIIEQSQKSEKARWNRILTAAVPRFNTRPNAFLVEVTRGLIPGKALDVGMGQGRNAL
jgi:hypothetical protein